MVVPMLADLSADHEDWEVFAISAAFTLFVGVALMLSNRVPDFALSIRQAFLLTTLSWIVTVAFAAVPLMLATIDLSYTDAFFEAMSGITTTGATVIVGLDNVPPASAVAGTDAMDGRHRDHRAGAVDPADASSRRHAAFPDGIVGEVGQGAAQGGPIGDWIGLIYLSFTMMCAIGYHAAGMDWFDAVAHAMTTIATGGFSTANLSLGYFDDPLVELVAIIFMLMGALPFVLYLRALHGDPRPLRRDTQVHWFLTIVAVSVCGMAAHLWFTQGYHPLVAIRLAGFNVVSVITGTGFATSDFGTWGSFAGGMMFFLMFVGGCAGSTTCGIKIFRFQVLYATARAQMRRLIQPHGVFIAYYNGRRFLKRYRFR